MSEYHGEDMASSNNMQTSEDCAFKLLTEMQKAAMRHQNYGHKDIKLDTVVMGMEITVNFKEKKRATLDADSLEIVMLRAYEKVLKRPIKKSEEFDELFGHIRRDLGL